MFLHDRFYYMAGLGFLALSKARNILQGYSSPKPIDISEDEKCIDYDIQIVDDWISYLNKFTSDESFIQGKNVLELGPGSDLGAGIYLLSLGAAKYNACDVNDLEKNTPDSFYTHFFERLKKINSHANIEFLKEQLSKSKAGNSLHLNYVVRKDFDLCAEFGAATIDIVFSQAAFEHFDDFEAVISQLSTVCKPGAVIIAEIDLMTHSRWIRDKDPNNIYRYHDKIYKAFWCRGIPNRVRPLQYREAFEQFGWTDVTIVPRSRLDIRHENISGLSKQFADKMNQMDYLTITLFAKR